MDKKDINYWTGYHNGKLDGKEEIKQELISILEKLLRDVKSPKIINQTKQEYAV